jgi:hypothetical protein
MRYGVFSGYAGYPTDTRNTYPTIVLWRIQSSGYPADTRNSRLHNEIWPMAFFHRRPRACALSVALPWSSRNLPAGRIACSHLLRQHSVGHDCRMGNIGLNWTWRAEEDVSRLAMRKKCHSICWNECPVRSIGRCSDNSAHRSVPVWPMNITIGTTLALGLRRRDGSARSVRSGNRSVLPCRDDGTRVDQRPLPVASEPAGKGFRSW